jgi:hypothetical protein
VLVSLRLHHRFSFLPLTVSPFTLFATPSSFSILFSTSSPQSDEPSTPVCIARSASGGRTLLCKTSFERGPFAPSSPSIARSVPCCSVRTLLFLVSLILTDPSSPFQVDPAPSTTTTSMSNSPSTSRTMTSTSGRWLLELPGDSFLAHRRTELLAPSSRRTDPSSTRGSFWENFTTLSERVNRRFTVSKGISRV